MSDTRFVRFIAASGLTNLADGIAVVAWAWLATLLTRDPLLIALVPVALRLPWFLCALPAGVITDRVDRLKLIVAMDVLRGAVFVVIATALFIAMPLLPPAATGVAQGGLFAMVLCGAGLVGVAEVFRDNAAQTMLPAIVDKSDLERANGRLWSIELAIVYLTNPIEYRINSPTS